MQRALYLQQLEQALERINRRNRDFDKRVDKERERCAKIVEGFDDFAYREVPGYGSVVLETESMKRLAAQIRSGK